MVLQEVKIISYEFLQHYWWFLVSLLGALLVFLMFVQGANSCLRSLGWTAEGRRIVVNSTGRKWELTFTTLVTFGGAFFASFPLFYSTSFGGAYWLWMIILFTFVLQAVSYEFQNKLGNLLGPSTFQFFLVLNGLLGPLLLGGAVATFFEGSNFIVAKENLVDAGAITPIISSWANASHGLDALLNPWVLVFGLAVMFLARTLGILYVMNNVADEDIRSRGSVRLLGAAVPFVILFVAYFIHLLLKDGYAYDPATGVIFMEPLKYLHNLVDMWYLFVVLLVGVVLVLFSIIKTIFDKNYVKGIWPAGIGVVLTVTALLLCAGWNNTAYYPSTADLQSSLTIVNSCSSEFTLRTMAFVSLLIPFVLAYIVYCWYSLDKKKIDKAEIAHGEHIEHFGRLIAKPAFASRELSSAVERGTAHHAFLQYCDFEAAAKDISSEINRLQAENRLSEAQAKAIDTQRLSAMLNTELFSRIIHSDRVYREERFFVKLKPSEVFGECGGADNAGIIVQGAVDLAFEENGGLVILDYKTDRVRDINRLCQLYQRQLGIYKLAMEQSLEIRVKELIIVSVYLNDYISLDFPE